MRTLLAVDLDRGLREELKRVARSRAGSVRAVVEAMVRAYLDGEIPDNVLGPYLRGRRGGGRG